MPNQANIMKIAVAVAVVAGGVTAAGYVMRKYQANGGNFVQQFLYDASNGFQGL